MLDAKDLSNLSCLSDKSSGRYATAWETEKQTWTIWYASTKQQNINSAHSVLQYITVYNSTVDQSGHY